MADARVAVLLGAGASVDAGLPTSIEMTNDVLDDIYEPIHRRLLEFVRHTLAADLAVRAGEYDPLDDGIDVQVDIERLFAAVQLLVDRRSQPWNPFVASWVSGLESFAPGPRVGYSKIESDLGKLERRILEDVDKLRKDVIQQTGPGASRVKPPPYRGRESMAVRSTAQSIARAIAETRDGDVGLVLQSAADDMLRALRRVLRLRRRDRVNYLRPLVELARRQSSLSIATLNYDRTIEQLADNESIPYATAIDEWRTRRVVDWGKEPIQLLKLHGSIDWVFTEERQPHELPFHDIHVIDPKRPEDEFLTPAIVFGEGGKLRAEGPFLELLLAWANAMEKAQSLLIVGYSFRDDHVNELIARWFNPDQQRRIVFVSPWTPQSSDVFASALLANAPNAADATQTGRVVHLVGKAKEHLPQAVAIASEQYRPLHAHVH